MASKPQISTKRLAISKANAQMVAVVAVASFVTIFCLVASKAVFSQNRYQARVTTAKEKAHDQLKKNIEAFGSLQTAYKAFDSQSTNIIGGSRPAPAIMTALTPRFILDALPSTYDFPALASSLEKS